MAGRLLPISSTRYDLMAQLQKGQSYPEMGFRVDGKGIAYDLTTGASLPKAEVNARLAKSGTGMSNLDTKRGGVNGFYDKNKSWAVPLAELAAGVLTGGATLPALMGAAAGANSLKHPDLLGAAKGGVSGYALGNVGAGLGGAASSAGAVGASDVANAGLHATDPSLLERAGSAVSGLMPHSIGEAVDKVGGLIPKALGAVQSATGGQGLGMTGLEVAQGLNAANLSRQSTDAANKAVGIMQQNYDAKAPLRDAGIKGLLNPVPLDTSGLTKMRLNSGNPFARPIAVGG